MYVVKVGEFYVKDVEVTFGGYTAEITLSKELMKSFTQESAERIAKKVNGEVISMGDVVTNE